MSGCRGLIRGASYLGVLIHVLMVILRYQPTAPRFKDLQDQLGNKRAECGKGPYKPLIALYMDIRKRFKPVMRHFFTERHKNPITWFATRLNYTRSVATTSIVGHVLGIGDRHPSNMLMDKITGEIIHIDFGIAFDQVLFCGIIRFFECFFSPSS
jgi:ataxia telangiectasia mutated family protein